MKLNRAPLKDVKLGQPMIQEMDYFASITGTLKDNKAGTGKNLVIQSVIVNEELVERESGERFANKRGYKLTTNMSLVPTDNYDPDKRLKELAVAIGLPEYEDIEDTHLAKPVYVKVKVAYIPPKGKYGEKMDVSRFLVIKDSDKFNPPY